MARRRRTGRVRPGGDPAGARGPPRRPALGPGPGRRGGSEDVAGLEALRRAHQATELRPGFDLEETVAEYLVLGQVLVEVVDGLPAAERPSFAEQGRIHLAVGAACVATVGVFFERVRTGIAAERRLLRRLDDVSHGDGVESPPRWILPALDALLESVGASAGALFLFDADSGQLALAAARGLPDPKPLGQPALVDLVTGDDAPRVLSATDEAPAVARALRQNRMVDGLAARLFSRGRPLGVVYVTSARSHSFGFLETRRFARFAGRVAVFLDLARLDQTRLALVDRLEGEVRLRQEAVSHLGHDLRGHLAAIRLTAQAIEGRPDDAPRTAKLAARITGSVDAADRQLEDVLLTNRVGAGERLPLRPTAVDVGELVRELVATLAASEGGGIDLEVTGDTNAELDADLVRRAVRHLIDNACHHGTRGQPLRLAVRGTPEQVAISVTNAGPPLPADQLRALVAPVTRGTPRRALGLGLTLVQGCAAAHGGRLDAVSDAEAGTTFTLALPRAPASP